MQRTWMSCTGTIATDEAPFTLVLCTTADDGTQGI